MPAFNIKTFLIVAVFFAITSCEDIVELPFDVDPTIEIRSKLSEDGLIAQVLLAKNASDILPNQYIDSAIVEVYENDSLLQQLELSYDSQGRPFYKTKDWVPVYDVEYTLKVEVETFKTVSAKTIVPKPVSIEQPAFNSTDPFDVGSETVQIDFDVAFSINDPAQTKNYYHLSFYQELYEIEISENGEVIPDTNSVEFVELNVKEVDESGPAEKYQGSEYLFSDDKFNGQLLRLAFKGSFEFDKSKKAPGQFYVELRTVSEAYYKNKLSQQNVIDNEENSVINEVFFDNTENGVGTFAGFTSNTNKFRLQGG